MHQIQSIISWNISNINGLTGNKCDDPDFVQVLKNHTVICLQETNKEVSIPGYRSFSDLRTNGTNGGVTTLISNKVAHRCSIVKHTATSNRSMNIVVIKLSTAHARDLYIINVYIPPANSCRKIMSTDSQTNFDILHEITSNLAIKGNTVVCGDLNARIGNSVDFYTADKSDEFIDLPSSYSSYKQLEIPPCTPINYDRNTQDGSTNTHKSLLLEYVHTNNLLILNGRTIGDSLGRYTCLKWNGNSLVDYFMCSEEVLGYVKSLVVGSHTIYSDHNPVILSLWTDTNISSVTNKQPAVSSSAPFRYKITEEALSSLRDCFGKAEMQIQIRDLHHFADRCSSTEDAKDLCDKFTDLINTISSKHLEKSNPNSKASNSKHNVWFDKDCHSAKKQLNKSSRILGKHPDNSNIKIRHRANARSYRKLVKNKKDRFFKSLNQKITNGRVLSWKDFNKLKKFTKSAARLDDDLLDTFGDFYKNLYSDEHMTIDQLTKAALIDEADDLVNSSHNPSDILNSIFTQEELNSAIAGLKSGKASSFDHIPNEILDSLSPELRSLLLKLFNICLTTGSYFWSSSIITPIHKKGDVSDPENYRAIAVCSCIGKLFSTMLLSRLISHRSHHSPDPANQRGFTKGSQCSDHIFTLLTIIEKYKKAKRRVHAVFIDLRKAFDLVCRQALLFKLACYGVDGGFFRIIKTMYSDSTGCIKINGKIGKSFKLLKGTEQGHPLSPELFKVYFRGLSDLLNKAITDCPTLSGINISHLAWADDLVILALNPKSLQSQLKIIEDYCSKWGLEINISKTKYLVMNSRQSSSSSHDNIVPTLNGRPIERVSSYCYLGIIISSNGKFKQAIDSLSHKGLGALFDLRKTVDRRFINTKSHDQLFNTLVSPILTYGCQVWLPASSFMGTLIKHFQQDGNLDKAISLIASQPYEKVHLRHIKYMIGTNRRSVNATAWGETGKYPLFVNCIRLCINYFKRISNFPKDNFARAALSDQIRHNLSWFNNIKGIIECFDDVSQQSYQVSNNPDTNSLLLSDLSSPNIISENIRNKFISSWKSVINTSSKLDFYKTVKSEFAWENYLTNVSNFNERRSMSRIRCSSHTLNIEVGRYSNIARSQRTCDYCTRNNQITCIEDENHILHNCPLGSNVRDEFYQAISDINSDVSQFNIAETCPASYLSDVNYSQNTYVKIVRLSCNTIHRLYSAVLEFKEGMN